MNQENREKFNKLIQNYLSKINEIGLDKYIKEYEGYKFKFVSNFQSKFDIQASDFGGILDSALLNNNLTSGRQYFPKIMLIIFARESEGIVREALRRLFDENQNIIQRINEFKVTTDNLMDKRNERTGKSDTSYIGLRFISLLLSARFPERYYHIKVTEWKKFIQFMEDGNVSAEPETLGERYEYYVRYAKELTVSIKPNQEIQKIHAFLTQDTDFKDPEFIWMTQDVIYTTSRFKSSLKNGGPEGETDLSNELLSIIQLLENKKQVILFGPPGTGKTFNTKILSVELIKLNNHG